MCFYGYFLSKMWFCLLGLSVFLLGALPHKFPHHSSLNSRGTRLELVALLLVTFVFYGYFWAGNPYEILLLLLLSPQDTNQFFSLSLVVVAAEGSSQDSKLEFSEDEETLITRMFNLVGERCVSLLLFILLFLYFSFSETFEWGLIIRENDDPLGGLWLLGEFLEERQRKLRSTGLQDIHQVNERPEKRGWCFLGQGRKILGVVRKFSCLVFITFLWSRAKREV